MTTSSRPGRPAVLAAISLLLASCSFTLSGPPSPYRRPNPLDCDVSRAAPIADTIAATAGVTSAIYLSAVPSMQDCDDVERSEDCHMLDGLFYLGAALILIPTAIYTGAAVVGFNRTSSCREAMTEYERPDEDVGVLLVAELGSSRSRVERALRAGRIAYDSLSPQDFDIRVAADELGHYSVIVVVDHDPRALPPPPINVLAFRSEGADAPFRLTQALPSVRVDHVDKDHPALRGVDLVGSKLEAVSALTVDPARNQVALAATGPHVVIAARSTVDGRTLACGFDPEETSWAGSAAFTSFVHAAVMWLARGEEPRT